MGVLDRKAESRVNPPKGVGQNWEANPIPIAFLLQCLFVLTLNSLKRLAIQFAPRLPIYYSVSLFVSEFLSLLFSKRDTLYIYVYIASIIALPKQ